MMKKILVVVIILIGVFILLKSQYSTEVITQEKIIEEFNDNRDYFNVIKEYLLSQPENYYINIDTYSDDINNPEVVEAITYLVNDLNYKKIYTSGQSHNTENYYMIFLKNGNDSDELGVIYTNSTVDYGMTMELIADNWYFHWMGYDY